MENSRTKRKRNARVTDTSQSRSTEFPWFITFSNYFIAWLSKAAPKYQAALHNIAAHEKLVKLNKGPNSFREGSRQDIRRLFFITEKGIITFGFICDEYGAQSVSYLAYLESSVCPNATNMTRPIIQAYSEYISLISSGQWRLHIWADPPKINENYLFRNADGNRPLKSAAELKVMYAGLLNDSGFDVSTYEWRPEIPPLPTFGKKGEDKTKEDYNKLTTDIEDLVQTFNKNFANTCCSVLQRPEQLEHIQFDIFIFKPHPKNNRRRKYWAAESISKDPSLDFSASFAKQSSELLISKMMNGARSSNSTDTPDYYVSDFRKLREVTGNTYEKYCNLIDAFPRRTPIDNGSQRSNTV